ncbi:MAG: hypothetical protein NTW87_12775 [Planctomycetota bacterium]|nr:hypothetical protein [Planctomycetota bacterium]
MKRPLPTLVSCCLAALLAVPGCTITTEGIQQAELPLSEVFPPSKTVASYRQLNKPTRIADADLETQFDGKGKVATLRKWSVLSTLSADYGIPKRPPTARVSVTELASKQNAYGAYSNLRPGLLPESNYIKIGVHGTVDGERLMFVQDRFVIVVRDLSGAADPTRRSMLVNFGRAISDRIPRDITDINLVSYLPYENRVPATERLDKEDPLGLGLFKAGGVTALYRSDDKARECKVFMAEGGTTSSVKDIYGDVKKAMLKEGPLAELSIGNEGAQGRLFKSLAMVARRELVVFGCYGTMTDREMKNVMAGIDRRVKPYVPPKIKEKPKEEKEEEKKGLGPFTPSL